MTNTQITQNTYFVFCSNKVDDCFVCNRLEGIDITFKRLLDNIYVIILLQIVIILNLNFIHFKLIHTVIILLKLMHILIIYLNYFT